MQNLIQKLNSYTKLSESSIQLISACLVYIGITQQSLSRIRKMR